VAVKRRPECREQVECPVPRGLPAGACHRLPLLLEFCIAAAAAPYPTTITAAQR